MGTTAKQRAIKYHRGRNRAKSAVQCARERRGEAPMQLNSIIVRASSPADVRRLRHSGGEVWQEYYQGMPTGDTRWRSALVKVPADAAIRLRLVTLGTDVELAGVAPGARASPANEEVAGR